MIVVAGQPTSLSLSPVVATVAPGASQVYAAEGFDSHGNDAGDVTAFTVFSIAPSGGTGSSVGASCSGDACSATASGTYLISADDSQARLATGSAELIVAPVASLQLSPASASVAAGKAQAYSADGLDAGDVDLGDVTGSTVFSIAPDTSGSAAGASCGATACSATAAGTYTVTGTDGSATGTATLTVTPAMVDAADSTATASPGSVAADGSSSATVTVTAEDAYGDQEASGGATVKITSSLGTVSGVTDHGNGTYTATCRTRPGRRL